MNLENVSFNIVTPIQSKVVEPDDDQNPPITNLETTSQAVTQPDDTFVVSAAEEKGQIKQPKKYTQVGNVAKGINVDAKVAKEIVNNLNGGFGGWGKAVPTDNVKFVTGRMGLGLGVQGGQQLRELENQENGTIPIPKGVYAITTDKQGNLSVRQVTPGYGDIDNLVGVAVKRSDGGVNLKVLNGQDNVSLQLETNGEWATGFQNGHVSIDPKKK